MLSRFCWRTGRTLLLGTSKKLRACRTKLASVFLLEKVRVELNIVFIDLSEVRFYMQVNYYYKQNRVAM